MNSEGSNSLEPWTRFSNHFLIPSTLLNSVNPMRDHGFRFVKSNRLSARARPACQIVNCYAVHLWFLSCYTYVLKNIRRKLWWMMWELGSVHKTQQGSSIQNIIYQATSVVVALKSVASYQPRQLEYCYASRTFTTSTIPSISVAIKVKSLGKYALINFNNDGDTALTSYSWAAP